MIGKTISHYKILEELGRGGMGVVYKAEDTKLKRTVALKFLPPELIRDPEAKKRFIHEAQAAAALSHPNICTVHEIDEYEGTSFIAMEYIEGQSLKEKVESGPLKVEQAVDIAIEVAEGLQEAHGKGIVHRDIKSANIMVTTKGQAKIMDFGLAKLAGRTHLTQSGTTIGTPAYMSPEQTRGEVVDQRTDIWSLGVVMYEMVTGQLPFKGEYEQAVIYSILNEEPQPPTALRSDLPEELEHIIVKALAKDPDKRYRKVEELLQTLRNLKKKVKFQNSAEETEMEEPTPSIAVLPFSNISADPEQEYFCDGMAEEIINALTQIDGLRVVARTSAFAFKGKNVDIREIGRVLNVSTILEGSVRKAGNRVRITAQLINVADGYHLWSEKYDRNLEDIFAVQDEISLKITQELKGQLFGEEKDKLVRKPVEDLEAYQLLLKGRYFANRMTRKDIETAIKYYQKALDRLPDFADAYAAISAAHTVQSMLGYTSGKKSWEYARQAALQALNLDRKQVDAHMTLGLVKLYQDWDWQGAQKEFQIAHQLNPQNVTVHTFLALYNLVLGKMETALQEARLALELDPISPRTNITLAVHLIRADKLEEAKEQIAKIMELVPDHPFAHYLLGQIFVLQNNFEEAITHYKASLEQSGETGLLLAALGWAYGRAGKKEEALSYLRALEQRTRKEPQSPVLFTRIYAALNDFDRAFEYLEKAYREHDPSLINIKTEESIRSLHRDRRFEEILVKMGLARNVEP